MLQGQALQDAYNKFITDYSVRKGLVEGTILNKKQALDDLIPFLNGRPFATDTANEYAQYKFNNEWIKPNSQINIIKNLRAFVSYLFEYDFIPKNFSKQLIRPKSIIIPEALPDIDEAEQAIIAGTESSKYDHSYHRERKALMRFALQFALRTGIRGNELINIRGQDLFIDKAEPRKSKVFLIAAKGGIPQWQPLPEDLLPELKKHTDDNIVFPVSIKTCNMVLQRGAKSIGLSSNINMHVHILRKVFGTTLSRYLTMAKVAKLMRHTDISITQKFYISYGLSELGDDLNLNHPLIRIAISPEDDIRAFIYNIAIPHFRRNTNIKIAESHDAGKRKFLLEIAY